MKKNNENKIVRLPGPKVLLNVCTHGNEKVGLKVAEYFKKYKMPHGSLTINIANKKAVKQNKRYIEHDLNRAFPGKRKGSHEEMLAFKMIPFIRSFDLVLDVHSTESGVRSILIVTKLSPKIRSLIYAISPRRVVLMRSKGSTSLISQAKEGIAFEYGKDKNKTTYSNTITGIHRALQEIGVIQKTLRKKQNTHKKKPEFYEAIKALPKPDGYVVKKSIRNFKLIKKGEEVGINPRSGHKIKARETFYPFLFGKNTYGKIFGFIAKKISL